MLIYENRPSIINFFGVKELVFMNFHLKMDFKMISRVITKNQAADTEIGFPTESILKPFGHTDVPTAWELIV